MNHQKMRRHDHHHHHQPFHHWQFLAIWLGLTSCSLCSSLQFPKAIGHIVNSNKVVLPGKKYLDCTNTVNERRKLLMKSFSTGALLPFLWVPDAASFFMAEEEGGANDEEQQPYIKEKRRRTEEGDTNSPSVLNPLENRPRAPREALVPATKQRLLLTQCLDLANRMAKDQAQTLLRLREILDPPEDETVQGRSRQGGGGFRTSRQAISMTRRYQMDQKQVEEQLSSSRLSGRSIRASMNVYTANLRFGESYVLTASPEIRKQLIRNDQLPDVRQVITADLDLRDLYRNRVQTLIEDAQAELYKRDGPDPIELQSLLEEASSICDKWFGLISPDDVQEALTLVNDGVIIQLPNQKFRGVNWWS